MAEGIDEQIAEYLKDRVNEITIANGFHQNLTAIRPKNNEFSDVVPANGVVVIWQADEEAGEPTYGADGWMQPFILMGIVLGADEATQSLDTLLNHVKWDIRKKLAADRKCGGLVSGMNLNLPSRKFDDGKGFTGIAVPVMVQYGTAAGNPYMSV
ncbi:MAG: hypothetical protein LLF76_03015 [Planctomycetaceae bacterium]|nr:hypothetical protein [Planctomycetaceae bacterium]